MLVGRVRVIELAGEPDNSLVVFALVELLKIIEPVLVDDVPSVSELAPVIVSLPFRLMVEPVG